MPSDTEVAHSLFIRGFRLMEQWDDEEAQAIIAPNMFNGESKPEPLAARQEGIPGVRGTYDWLHTAYEDLHWEIHMIDAEGDWAVGRTTMSGRQTGPFTQHGPDGEVQQAFPATNRPFAVSQTHWYRIADGKLVEHHADRDDLGQAMQLGWFGPMPEATEK